MKFMRFPNGVYINVDKISSIDYRYQSDYISSNGRPIEETRAGYVIAVSCDNGKEIFVTDDRIPAAEEAQKKIDELLDCIRRFDLQNYERRLDNG